jgi:hypothetical protein
MGEIELARPSPELTRRLRKQWGRERAEVVIDRLLHARLREFDLHETDRLYTIAEGQLIRRGNRIANMLSTTNPLNRDGLERMWDAWLATVEALLAEKFYG